MLRVSVWLDFKEDFKEDRPLLVLGPVFKVELYEVSKDLTKGKSLGLVDYITGSSLILTHPATDKTIIYVDIPISQALVNTINEVKSLGRLPALNIEVRCKTMYYEGYSVRPSTFTARVSKAVYGRERDLIVFTTDEVDLLMEKLKYVEILRIEIPLPLEPEHPAQERLVKSVKELMAGKELLMKGKYHKVLNTCRNIILNYLTAPEERSKIHEEIENFILSRVLENKREFYRDALIRVGRTLHGLLQYLHKFIKEDTGRLREAPLRADAEYAFYTLFSIVKYLVEVESIN